MRRLALKFLDEGARGPFSDFAWPTPNGGKPGKWVRAEGKLVVCENGIHACTLPNALAWLDTEAYLIELDGRILDEQDKLCARRGRLVRRLAWDDKSACLFAADCAERALPIFERECPNDDQPRKAIEAARAYVRGEIDASSAAAYADTAYAYADTAYAYAAAAAYTASAASAARAIGAASAASAASYAASAASYADTAYAYAASAAECKWQSNRLATYLKLTREEKKAVS